MAKGSFKTEADLVAAFCAEVERLNEDTRRIHPTWTIYHETAGWDLLLVEDTYGIQIGVEAKLSLNPKVLSQALPYSDVHKEGPDYRAVLVPAEGCQLHMERITEFLGLTIITARLDEGWKGAVVQFNKRLPDENADYWGLRDWFPWCPEKRHALPAYVPDVQGGKAAPLQLTEWKVKAIKLMILLERRGYVTRMDMRALRIDATRWTSAYQAFLKPGPDGGYVACERTPDFKAQHPRNWAEIEAEYDSWSSGLFAGALV